MRHATLGTADLSRFQFLSTHSVRSATQLEGFMGHNIKISIHALRKECDIVFDVLFNFIDDISIHALRKECDTDVQDVRDEVSIFLSTHSVRSATLMQHRLMLGMLNFYPRTP